MLTNESVLAVNFTKFTATVANNAVLLKWTAADAENNNYFEVEKSADAIHFTAIAKVKAIKNNYTYTYTDNNFNVSNTNVYYRIKSVDNNNESSVSKIVLVNFSEAFQILNIYPNPSNSVLNVYINNLIGDAAINIYDANGKLVLHAQKIFKTKQLLRLIYRL